MPSGDKPSSRPYSLSRHRLPEFDYASTEHAYFVTVRAEQGLVPFRREELAEAVVSSLEWLRSNRGIKLYAYCLMPDHLHLLLQFTEDGYTLGDILHSLKSFTTRASWKLGHKGPLWQDRFYDHVVRGSEDGLAIARYILDNPVRKGLVAIADEYRWSGMPDPM